MINLGDPGLRPIHGLIEARIGKRISAPCLWRWVHKGVNGVRLETVRIGGRQFSTEAALTRFFELQNVPPEQVQDAPEGRTPETAGKLAAAGLV